MARAFWSDHHDVNVFGRLDCLEMNREPVREAEDLAFTQVRLDSRFVKRGLSLVRRQNLDPVGALGGFGWSNHVHAIGSRLLGRIAFEIQADDYIVSAVAQILRLRVSLRTVAENGDGFALQGRRVSVVL